MRLFRNGAIQIAVVGFLASILLALASCDMSGGGSQAPSSSPAGSSAPSTAPSNSSSGSGGGGGGGGWG